MDGMSGKPRKNRLFPAEFSGIQWFPPVSGKLMLAFPA
jgi:hypothetical protein